MLCLLGFNIVSSPWGGIERKSTSRADGDEKVHGTMDVREAESGTNREPANGAGETSEESG
jgi:hypothetical protein